MIGPLRKVMPNPWLVRVPLLLIVGAAMIIGLILLVSPHETWEDGLEMLMIFSGVIVGYWAAFFGGYRAFAFNPLIRRDYHEWLSLSAWTSDKPLPGGPLRLTWQDLAVVGLLGAVSQAVLVSVAVSSPSAAHEFLDASGQLPLFWLIPVAAFLCTYLMCWLMAFMMTDRPVAYGIIGVCLAVFSVPHPASFVGGLVVCLCLAQLGILRLKDRLARSFREAGSREVVPILTAQRRTGKRTLRGLGDAPPVAWPHAELAAVEDKPRIALWEKLALSGLVFLFWHFLLTMLSRTWGQVAHESPIGAMVSFTLACCAIRLYFYCYPTLPPISIAGRILTGRLIIPKYDRVFVPVLTMMLIGCVFTPALAEPMDLLDFPLVRVLASAMLALVVFIGLHAGPRLSAWRATCPCRLVPHLTTSTAQNQTRKQ